MWRCGSVCKGAFLFRTIIVAVLSSLKAQGRLDAGLINASEWGNLGILVALGILRAAFVLGVGLKSSERFKGKKA